MGRFVTTLNAARYLHQDDYPSDFEVAVCKRSGPFDFFPFSMFYGISDLGSWDCIVSTNGSKIVITKSHYMDLEEINFKVIIEKSDILNYQIGWFKVKIQFRSKMHRIGSSFKFRIEDEFNRKGKLCETIPLLRE